MSTTLSTQYEKQRLQELLHYNILDSPAEEEFDDLVKIVAKLFNVQVAAISFVDNHRQWFKAKTGVNFCETQRESSVCNYTIQSDEILEIQDLVEDERTSHFFYVSGSPYLRFYAGMPLITKKGYRIGVLCLLDDKTRVLNEEEKQMLKAYGRNVMALIEARLYNRELESLNKAQKRISCTLSHDIRNPLNSVKMLLDMQDEIDNPSSKEEGEMINRLLKGQVDNTISLLNNIIEWGKVELHDSQVRVKPAYLRKVVSEAIKEIEISGILKGNHFVNNVPSEIMFSFDREGLRFVLRNLLSNANKFTDHGVITISYAKENKEHMISVTDNGVGMAKEQVRGLNLNEDTSYCNGTRNEKGNGLGLGLVNEYLTKSNRFLHFESAQGIGTKVSFSL